MRRAQTAGFALVELINVVAIIAILAAITIPLLWGYASRTRAAASMAELSGYRIAISACVAERQGLSGCDAGMHGIPVLPATYSKNLVGISSIVDGVIVATSGATETDGTAMTIVDAPLLSADGFLRWRNTGTICNDSRGLKAGQGDCP